MSPKVVHLEKKPEGSSESPADTSARLWQDMENSFARWQGLAQGAPSKRRLDTRGSAADVYAYCAFMMRVIKRKSVDAIYMKRESEKAVRDQIMAGLEQLQTECESALQGGPIKQSVSRALTDCVTAVRNMYLAPRRTSLRARLQEAAAPVSAHSPRAASPRSAKPLSRIKSQNKKRSAAAKASKRARKSK